VVITYGLALALFGLAVYRSQTKGQQGFRWMTLSDIPTLLFFSSIFFVMLFHFIDYDVPEMADLIKHRHWSMYLLAQTGTLVTLLLATCTFVRRYGALTFCTIISWSYYTIAGYLFGIVHFSTESSPILLPFPMAGIAIMLDASVFLFLKKVHFPFSFKTLFATVFIMGTICYWSLVVWAACYTHIPQQISGDFTDWLVWYFISIPLVLIPSTILVKFVSRLAPQDSLQKKRE
jgi:hypothetical protein